MLIGLASQAYVASARARSRASWPAAASLARAPEGASPIGGRQALHRFDERRQRRLGIRGHREVDFGVSLEVLVVGLQVQIARGDADELDSRSSSAGLRRALQLVAERLTVPQEVHRPPGPRSRPRRAIAARARSDWFSGCREGKFMRPP